ncbi:radical_SAM domain-containing protein, partial [Haematococcus lacustris]
ARELAELLRSYDLFSHVNVIPWNPVDDSHYKRPSRDRVMAFVKELDAAGVPATIRMTKGLEAAAACGQLRNNFQKQPLAEFAVPK